MHCLYDLHIEKGRNKFGKITSYIYCSKRLVELILKKDAEQKWLYHYFLLTPFYSPIWNDFHITCMSSSGIILVTKGRINDN